MKVYHYHPITKEYLLEGLADQDPLEQENWLIPANATDVEPPTVGANEVAIFDNGVWMITADFRGSSYYQNDGSKIDITEIGINPEDDVEYFCDEPPPKKLETVKTEKLNEINTSFGQAMLPIINGIPATERDSWAKQEDEARAYIAYGGAATPLIDALAATRGVDKAELVSRIIAKADLFATISGQLIGKRQALEDAVNALSDKATADDVDAIKW
jgi:hypothetical protein